MYAALLYGSIIIGVIIHYCIFLSQRRKDEKFLHENYKRCEKLIIKCKNDKAYKYVNSIDDFYDV